MTKMTKAIFDALPENVRLGRILRGTFYYASVHEPNYSAQKMFGADPSFSVKVGLDKENLKLAKEIGLRIQEPNENIPEQHVEIKRKVKDGKDIKISIVDSTQNDVPPSILIGNGSKGSVKFATYFYENFGGGVGSSLYKMQVTELVPFKARQDDDFVTDEKGFSAADFVPADDDSDVPFDVDTAAGGDIFDD